MYDNDDDRTTLHYPFFFFSHGTYGPTEENVGEEKEEEEKDGQQQH